MKVGKGKLFMLLNACSRIQVYYAPLYKFFVFCHLLKVS